MSAPIPQMFVRPLNELGNPLRRRRVAAEPPRIVRVARVAMPVAGGQNGAVREALQRRGGLAGGRARRNLLGQFEDAQAGGRALPPVEDHMQEPPIELSDAEDDDVAPEAKRPHLTPAG